MTFLVVTEHKDHYTVHHRCNSICGCSASYGKDPWNRKIVKLVGKDSCLSYLTKDAKVEEIEPYLYDHIHEDIGIKELDQLTCR